MLITNKTELEQFQSDRRIWQGIPGIVHTKKGRTFIAFYSGNITETYGNYAVVIMSENGRDFGEPVAAANKIGNFRCFDPVLWIDPLERLWFIWNVAPGEQVMAAICDDPDADELIWQKEFCIGRGVMMNKPTVLSSGQWLFPIAFWKKEISYTLRKPGLKEDDVAGAFVYQTSDNGKTFVKLGGADVKERTYDEHQVIELGDSVLMMLIRTVYGIGRSYSYDCGKNWSCGENSGLGGPSSRFFIGRLRSGRILLINHVNFTGRNNLTALLSEDDGKTFPYSLLLDERNEVSYPDAMEDQDGFIHIVYDRERGGGKLSPEEAYGCAREILNAKITEEDIIKGELVHEGSFLKNIANKLGKLNPGCEHSYYQMFEKDDRAFAEKIIEQSKDRIIDQILKQYSIYCTSQNNVNIQKIDALIRKFQNAENKELKYVMDIISYLRSVPGEKRDPHPIVDRVREYVEDHLLEDISLSKIADDMHISVYYLSHVFKSVTGTTIIGYKNARRIAKAKQMLANTNEPIGAIAEALGYNTASYFAELFTKTEGISPTEYRNYNQTKP